MESTAPCAAAVRCDTCPALQGIADGMVQDDIEDLEDEGCDGDVSPTAAAGGEGVTTVWVGNIPDTIIKV